MAEILEVLLVIVKELIEVLPACGSDVSAEGMNERQAEAIQQAGTDLEIVMRLLPLIMNQNYLNPILSIPDLLNVSEEWRNDGQKLICQLQREETVKSNSIPVFNLRVYVPMILQGIFKQIQYKQDYLIISRLPEDYSFDPDSGIDADFDMYRNSLKKVLVALIRLYPSLYLDFIDQFFVQVSLDRFQTLGWQEAEAILTFVFYFGDGTNVNLPNNAYRGTFISFALVQLDSQTCWLLSFPLLYSFNTIILVFFQWPWISSLAIKRSSSPWSRFTTISLLCS